MFPAPYGTIDSMRAVSEELEGFQYPQRVFVGSFQRSALLMMSDLQDRTRIRMYVDSAGTARLEFYDEAGETVLSLPE